MRLFRYFCPLLPLSVAFVPVGSYSFDQISSALIGIILGEPSFLYIDYYFMQFDGRQNSDVLIDSRFDDVFQIPVYALGRLEG